MSSNGSAFLRIQQGVISASLNSSMLFSLFMGIYSIVYVGTMYLYISRKGASADRCIYMTTITVLYSLCLIQFAVQWYFINLSIVMDNDTRESMFWATIVIPRWTLILGDIVFYASLVISDALLIWRCYHVWGRSLRISTAPVILLIAETGLFISAIIVSGGNDSQTTPKTLYLLQRISSASILVPLGTTALTTFLIGYRVYSASISTKLPSQRLFNMVVRLLVDSAAGYSISLLFVALCIVVPSFSVVVSPIFQAKYYAETLLITASGMAPTILAGRLALIDSNSTVTDPTPSGLIFRSFPESAARDRDTRRGSDDLTPPPEVQLKEFYKPGLVLNQV